MLARQTKIRRSYAAVFPGAGVPLCGAEGAFLDRHEPLMAPFLEQAGQRAGADLQQAVVSGDVAALNQRARELFAHAFNCAMWAVLEQHIGARRPIAMAGHSLGVYSALSCSGALSFEDGLRLVDRAHEAAGRCCTGGHYGMGVVVGLERDALEALLPTAGDDAVVVANHNNHTSFVLSGERDAVQTVIERADPAGAVVATLLDLQTPYHHPRVLAPASAELALFMEGLSWASPCCPIISTIDHGWMHTPEQLADFTARNISTPIHWQGVVQALAGHGVDTLLECGPGLSLTQSARFIQGAPRHINVKNARQRLEG